MENKVFEINVDFKTKLAVEADPMLITKGDYNSIEFDLKMDKTDYQRAVLFLVKPSKKNLVVDIANSKAIFTEKNTFNEIGIYYYGIVLYGTDSKLTTATKGKIQVVEGYNENNEDITGDENYPILDTLIEEVTDLKDKINASLGVMNKTFKEVTYDASTGVMSFKNLNNEVTNINLPLSLLISNASYDNDNKKIVLTLANNDSIDIPVLDLVSNYYDDKINANKEYIASTSNELYRLKTDVLETGESSGNNIHLEDSALSEMQEISIEMDKDRVQGTTTGKNLLPYPWFFINPTTLNGITITDNNDGKSLTVSGTSTDVTTFVLLRDANKDIIKDDVAYYLQGGKSTNARLYFNTGSMDTGNGTSYTYSNESTSTRLVGVYIPSGVTINEIIYPMLSEGSEATDYEPYTGGQPSPSPDYPQEIKTLTGDIKLTSCGKNLLNITDISSATKNGITYSIKNNILTLNGTSSNIVYLSFNLKKTIQHGTIISYGTNNEELNSMISCRLAYNNRSIYQLNLTSTNAKKENYKVNNDINQIYIVIEKGIVLSNFAVKLMLNKGSKLLPYESYQSSSLNITIPENEFVGKINDTYKDTLNVVYKNDGHYHLILNKMIGKFVLDGSESIWTATVEGIYTGTSSWGNKSQSKTLANYFQTFTTYNGGMKTSKNGAGFLYPNVNQYYLKIDGITTVEELKTWLSTHNTEVYYILETPYEVDLGIVDQLLTYDEITNIFTDSDLYPVINVKYYRNFIKTIQNLQVNNDTLKNELSNIESRLAALESANTNVIDNNPSDTEEIEVTE